jgi:hypothetical protein
MKTFTNEFNPDTEVVCTDGVLKTHKVCLQFLSEYFNTYFTTTMHTENVIIVEYPRSVLLYIMNVLFYKIKDPRISCSEYHVVAHCADFLIIDGVEALVNHMVCNPGCVCKENHKELQDLFIAHRKIFDRVSHLKSKIIHTIDSSQLKGLLESQHVRISDLSREQCYGLYKSGYRTSRIGTCSIFIGEIMDLLTVHEIYEVLSHTVYVDNDDYHLHRYLQNDVSTYLKSIHVPGDEIMELRCCIGVPLRMQNFIMGVSQKNVHSGFRYNMNNI